MQHADQEEEGESLFLANPAGQPSAGVPGKSTGEETVTCDFDNVDIRVVIKFFSRLTGKNFIIYNNVRGTITLVAPTAFPVSDPLKILGSVLDLRGYALVPAGDFIKVMSKRNAVQRAIPLEKSDGRGSMTNGDEVITRIIPLKFASADKMRRALSHLFSKDSSVSVSPQKNLLIITDTGSSIDRLVTVIDELDRLGGETDIRDLINYYSQLTKRNFIVGSEVQGRVMILTPGGISGEKPLSSLKTILDAYGLMMKEEGDFIKIVRDPDKPLELLPLETPRRKTRHCGRAKSS